jgi:transposase InsO family protein
MSDGMLLVFNVYFCLKGNAHIYRVSKHFKYPVTSSKSEASSKGKAFRVGAEAQSPYYPQSNGENERWHKSLKGECIRPGTALSLEEARRLVKGYVEHYNNVRLNSIIGYIAPKDMLAGHQQRIQAERDRKLEAAREQRKNRRQRAA